MQTNTKTHTNRHTDRRRWRQYPLHSAQLACR